MTHILENTMSSTTEFTYYEFFAGGGMARAGLGRGWRCLFANDFDKRKASVYQSNWPGNEMLVGDVGSLTSAGIPGNAQLAWASFPCQDLSLAGLGAGLKGNRSGTFWPFLEIVKSLDSESRAPAIIALENVCGALSSHNGKDFASICTAMMDLDYTFGALVIDAALFLPQSRPRLFIVATKRGLRLPVQITIDSPHQLWHTKALLDAYAKLPSVAKDSWTWWTAPVPARRQRVLADIIEAEPTGVSWHNETETQRLLDMMSDLNRAKVRDAKQMKRRIVGTVYKRTRLNEDGKKVQRAEVRFDSVAGCLRTPAGGSSRQLILVIEGESVRSRLLSSRETARLMGLPDEYALPPNYNEAYHLTGDGVAVPVVRHLAEHIFEPVLEANKLGSECAA